MKIETEFLTHVRGVFRSQKDQLDKTLAQLRDDDLFWKPDPDSNSIAIIIKHLGGNMVSRWTDFLTTGGEKPYRNRDSEFITDQDTAESLKELLARGYKIFFETLDSLREDDLLKTVTIRSEPHTVIQTLIRQISHYGDHMGQIIYIAKHIKGSKWKTLSIPKGESEKFLTMMQNTKR